MTSNFSMHLLTYFNKYLVCTSYVSDTDLGPWEGEVGEGPQIVPN